MQRLRTALVLGCTLLAGCYASGTKVDQRDLLPIVRQAEEGKTSCDEIVAKLGKEPNNKLYEKDGSSQFIYNYYQSQLKPENFIPFVGPIVRGTTSEHAQTVLYCDPNGRYAGFTSNQGQEATGTGFDSGKKQK